MEKEASSWLTVLLLKKHHFTLHKQPFRDVLALRYGWQPSQLPTYFPCGQSFSIHHALSCPIGGYPSIDRMNYGTSLLHCYLKPAMELLLSPIYLQFITGQTFKHVTTNTQDGARCWRKPSLIIRCQGIQSFCPLKQSLLCPGNIQAP